MTDFDPNILDDETAKELETLEQRRKEIIAEAILKKEAKKKEIKDEIAIVAKNLLLEIPALVDIERLPVTGNLVSNGQAHFDESSRLEENAYRDVVFDPDEFYENGFIAVGEMCERKGYVYTSPIGRPNKSYTDDQMLCVQIAVPREKFKHIVEKIDKLGE